MINYNEVDSRSLLIAEGEKSIFINGSQQKLIEQDSFDYSKDEASISFQIQEQYKPIKFKQLSHSQEQGKADFNQIEKKQQNKKNKRRQIFNKYKKQENSIIDKVDSEKSSENILNIFDSIFNFKQKDSVPFCGIYDSSGISENMGPILEGISLEQMSPAVGKRGRLKIFDKKKTYGTSLSENSPRIPLINPSNQSQKEISQQRQKQESSKKQNQSRQSVQLSMIEKKISAIYDQDPDISRDSIDINNILQSQIFREQQGGLKFGNLIEEKAEQNNLLGGSSPQQLPQLSSINEPKPKENKIIRIQITIPIQQQCSKQIGQINTKQQVKDSIKQEPFVINQIEEINYIINDQASVTSACSIPIQHYQNQDQAIQTQNSMVNIKQNQFPSQASLGIRQNRLVQSRLIERQQQLDINTIFEEQNRLPAFLRKARKHISVYPNFYIIANNPNTPSVINDQFKQLFVEIKKCIDFLANMCQRILDTKSKIQLYTQQLINNLTIQFFLESGWQNIGRFDEIDLIKPKEPIDIRGWSYEKAKIALANYDNIVHYYSLKNLKLDFTNDKGRKKYFEIRQKIWDIIGNMKIISQDIYCQFRHCCFPNHYYQFLSFLKTEFPARIKGEYLTEHRRLKNLFNYLKHQKDIVINSQIGLKIKQKMDTQMRFLQVL